MPETVFRIALTPLAEPGRTGRDSVQFLFTANPRMTPQPVERIASGGELSRVMLALKEMCIRDRRCIVFTVAKIRKKGTATSGPCKNTYK